MKDLLWLTVLKLYINNQLGHCVWPVWGPFMTAKTHGGRNSSLHGTSGEKRRRTRAWYLLPEDASNNPTFLHQALPLKGSTTSHWCRWLGSGFQHVKRWRHFTFQTRQQPPLLPGSWNISNWALFIADIFHSPKHWLSQVRSWAWIILYSPQQ